MVEHHNQPHPKQPDIEDGPLTYAVGPRCGSSVLICPIMYA